MTGPTPQEVDAEVEEIDRIVDETKRVLRLATELGREDMVSRIRGELEEIEDWRNTLLRGAGR